MFNKTYHATHPDMMAGASNQQLRDRYLVEGLFAPDAVSLNYAHYERFIVGGAFAKSQAVKLPTQVELDAYKSKLSRLRGLPAIVESRGVRAPPHLALMQPSPCP